MENTVSTEKIYDLGQYKTDYSVSSLIGLSVSIVTVIFAITLWAIETARIHLLELIQGDFHIHGDPTLLYLAIFLISATMLIVIQNHFQEPVDDE